MRFMDTDYWILLINGRVYIQNNISQSEGVEVDFVEGIGILEDGLALLLLLGAQFGILYNFSYDFICFWKIVFFYQVEALHNHLLDLVI